MFKQLLEDLRDFLAWARSNGPSFVDYTGQISLMLFNAIAILSVLFSPALIANWLAPEWGAVALVANVIALAALVWVVSAYERSRA